jgi:hypothetical protein
VSEKDSRVVSATQEDLDRLYGSGRLVLGPVVRPKPEPELEDEVVDSEAEED